jgi:hypothetical protein
MLHQVSLCLVSLIAFPLTTVIAADGPAQEVTQLSALSHDLGNWEVQVTSPNSPFAKREATTQWILDGRFIQQSGTLSSANGKTNVKITTLMTYDPQQGCDRMWTFLSDGTAFESTGTWDEAKRTMTPTHHSNDSTTTTTARFTDDGVEEWTIVTTYQANEVIGRFTGKNKRR